MNEETKQILKNQSFLLKYLQSQDKGYWKKDFANQIFETDKFLNPVQEKEPYIDRAVEAINLIEGCGKIVNQFYKNEYVCSNKRLCPECQAKLDDAKNVGGEQDEN